MEKRTYCNNLALLAKLIYSEDKDKPKARVPIDDVVKPLNAGSFEFDAVRVESTIWRPILRVTEPGHEYQAFELTSEPAQGEAPAAGTTTPDTDGKGEDIKIVDTQGRVWVGTSHVIVAMRGTWEPTDIITDIVATKVSWPYGPGHVSKGFYLAFEAIRKQLDHALSDAARHLPVFVTGHSLGGALAALVALYIRDKYPARHVILYTYAQPRVVDITFVERCWSDPKLTYYRFESPVDPVPMVPSYRTASDLIRLLGDLPDTLLGRIHEAKMWQAAVLRLAGGPAGTLLSAWTSHEIDLLLQSVDRYKRLIRRSRWISVRE